MPQVNWKMNLLPRPEMNVIASAHNPLIKDVCMLHRRRGRQEQGRFLIEGWHILKEALKWRMPVETVVVAAGGRVREEGLLAQAVMAGAALVEVTETIMRKICTTEAPQGVACVVRRPKAPRSLAVRGRDIMLILDRIQDPGNLGGILRVALAADVSGVVLTRGCADPYGPKAVRGGMGSLFGLTVLTEMDAEACRELCLSVGARVLALAAAGPSFFDADEQMTGAAVADPAVTAERPMVLILGNEGQGISAELLSLAHGCRSLPMHHDVESLNVAVSAGIVLYELRRRRREWKENDGQH